MDGRAVSAGGSDAAPQVSAPPNTSQDLLSASRLTQVFSELSDAAVHRPPDPFPGPLPASRLMQFYSAAPSSASVQPPQALQPSPLQCAVKTTPSRSPARLTEASVAQHGQQPLAAQEPPTTPETASSGSSHRSASDDTPTSERGATAAQNAGSAVTMAAQSDNGDEQEKEAGAQGVEPSAAATARADPKGQQVSPQKKWYHQLPLVLDKIKRHGQEQIKVLALPRCLMCALREVVTKADVLCRQEGCILSGRPLCQGCWKRSHSSEDGQMHAQLPAAICPQCQLDRISYWCPECNLKFCKDCFEQIHSVPKVKHHRRIATEDSPGTCLAKSQWSAKFQNAIIQMIADKKHPASASRDPSTDVVGGKRKRDVEVIVIDDDDDDMDGEAAINVPDDASFANGSSGTRSDISGSAASQQNRGTTIAQNSMIRPDETLPPPTAPATTAWPGQNSVIEPIPFPQELTEAASTSSARFETVPTNSAFSAPMPNGNNQVNLSSSIGSMPWNCSAPQFAASTASMGMSGTYTSSMMSNGMMEVLPNSASSTSGAWSTTSAISTDFASSSNSTNLLPLGGAVFAENALVDSLVDRYHEMNQSVTTLEFQSEQLTRQIAVATCQGPYAAGPLMAALNKIQSVLEVARGRRDKLLIAMIIQSNDIMAAVRMLRLTELGDVPQVPMIGHRKCLHLTNEINQHKKKLLELNQQLSETLSQSHAVNSSWENSLIRTTSENIQAHEKGIKKLKKDREVEIVRIVQFSLKIREALKHAFQRSIEIRRQQQQQQQQQFHPFG